MPKIAKHANGDFCWFELGTTDQHGAKPFYTAVLGWSFIDFPMGPDGVYTMFRLNDGDAGAAYTMRPEEAAAVPPHWNPYVQVENADATAAKAKELGGKVVEAPFDVMTFGRMAVLQDPTGVYFNIWQPRDHIGTTIDDEPGTFCWADLSTPDPDKSVPFFEGLFGWKIGPMPPYPPQYPVVQNNGRAIAGVGRDTNLPPHWRIFFLSDDVDGMAAKAKETGGKVLMEPMSMGGARFAGLADPQGATFSIIKRPRP
jgi:predicted enzyme related to lactoylglutathione lyase